jgi:hypothetical protein
MSGRVCVSKRLRMLLYLPVCCCVLCSSCLLLLFFKNTRLILRLLCPTPPTAVAAPHASSYPQLHAREREHKARTVPHNARESTVRMPQCKRDPSYMRERGITTRVPQCEIEHNARAPMREREGAQRACTCVEQASCTIMGDHALWCRGMWCSACLLVR